MTNPPLLPWVCRLAHALTGVRYALLIHEVYPDIAIALGALKADGWIARTWRLLNRCAYERAERIVVLGRDMEEVISRQLPIGTNARLTVIPNWADGERITPVDRAQHPILSEQGALSRFVVEYSGNIGRFHEIDTILDAAARLDEQAAFLFFFYGAGQQVDLVRRAAQSMKNGTIQLHPFQPTERPGLTLTGCDVGLVTLKEGLSGLAVPSKLYGILAAGKAVIVIGPDDCEAARLVRENGCGEIVRPGDGASLAETLRRLRDDPARCAALGARSRRCFETQYHLPQVASRWAMMLKQLDHSAP